MTHGDMQGYLLILLIAIIFLVERFFAYRISYGFRKDIDSLRNQMASLVNEFAKLASLMQAFLMNVEFKKSKTGVRAQRRQTSEETQDEFPELRKMEAWQKVWENVEDNQ